MTVGIVAAVAIGALFLSQISSALVLCFGALIVAEGLRPMVDWLVARRLPRGPAILCLYVAGFGTAALLGWLLLTPLVSQVLALVDQLPQYSARVQSAIAGIQTVLHDNPAAQSLVRGIPSQATALLQRVLGFAIYAPRALLGAASNVLLLLLVAFFWLLATDELRTFILGLLPARLRTTAVDVFDDCGRKMGGYLRGVAINMVVIGILSGAGVALLGVPYALLLAVIAGITEAIPIVGPLIGGSVACVVALAADGPGKAGQVALLYLLIQQIEGNTLVPLVMNRVVALHPLTIVVALIVGSSLLGISGAVLAVPAAAVAQVIVVRVLAPLARRASTASDRNMP